MSGHAEARGVAVGHQTETILLDALLQLAGFQCCIVSKQGLSVSDSQLHTDTGERGDHSSPCSTKRQVASKASASSRGKAPPAGPEAGAEPTPPPTPTLPPSTSMPTPVAGAQATTGVAAECAARRTACRSTADDGAGRLSAASSKLTIGGATASRRHESSLQASIVPGPSHAASLSASDPLAASSGTASGNGVVTAAGAGKLDDGRGFVRRPSSSRTLQQCLKVREQKQDMIFRLEQRLVWITCEYGKVLQKGNDAARWRDKAGLRVAHHAKEELRVETKKIRTTLNELRGKVARLQECIDAWPEDAQTRMTTAHRSGDAPNAPCASQARKVSIESTSASKNQRR